MSELGSSTSWLERHWYWLVIGFGLFFVACLDFFRPGS